MGSDAPKWWWLALGAALLGLAHARWGIGALAWVAPVPFLHWLRGTTGWRSRVAFAVALFAGYSLAMLKIATAPVPPVFALLYAVPFTVLLGAGYLAWDQVRRHGGEAVAVLAFPAFLIVGETLQHRLTPFGSWGAAAYTQVDALPLLQVASLGGMAVVGFLIYWVAAALESGWARGTWRPLAWAAAFTAAALAYGTIRLGTARTGETVTVAAVGTDGEFMGWPLPGDDVQQAIHDGLFARTAAAADAGAVLVAWNEAATFVYPDEDEAFVARIAAAADAHDIDLVAAYLVPHDGTYENKYVWARPDGTIDHTYHKHHPVPGEPTTAGTSAPRPVETAAGRATGAICYDYDFPALALEHARLGIDLAVVPSSDWYGIDPIHTQMASLRAIEGGFSLLRSTRFGLSAGYDPYGRVRGWESSFDTSERVLLVALPVQDVWTPYTAIGDAGVWLAAAYAAAALLAPHLRRVRLPRPATSP